MTLESAARCCNSRVIYKSDSKQTAGNSMAPRVPYLLSRNSSSRYGTRYGTRGSRYGTRGARGARGASSVSLITVPAGLSRASRPASHGPGAHHSRHVAHRFLIVSARSVCVCVCVCARVSSLTSFSSGHQISCVHALACGLVCKNIIIINNSSSSSKNKSDDDDDDDDSK